MKLYYIWIIITSQCFVMTRNFIICLLYYQLLVWRMGWTCIARLRGLQKACVNGTVSRALATARDCCTPTSFNTVSGLEDIEYYGTKSSLYNSFPLSLVMNDNGWRYILFCFTVTNDDNLPLSVKTDKEGTRIVSESSVEGNVRDYDRRCILNIVTSLWVVHHHDTHIWLLLLVIHIL